ncbi:programmed cell death 6-interacting protein [Anthonomus grandis grandis]|uniref:programmed cell death 6-interacting protein n=1 Tax=Anthonomus grandis grandis TaxID=2921223 RepID=UPI002165A7A5|nr:programmed cell death 6-interacting protein [Anthonomus grandis grandis]
MADLLSVPLKRPSDVDITTPLKNLIQSRYSTADNPENCTEAVNEFSKLRNNAIWKAFEKYESSLDIIYGYYDQLVALEGKIPAQELQVPFKWKDAFDRGNIFGHKASLTVPSLSFEKVCVLFNIAGLQSAIAANQSLESDDGLKLAAKLLQQAAGIFSHLKSTVMLAIQSDPTPDLNPDTLGALSQLMLAQAQEVFVHKSMHDNMKDSIVAKLAAQADDLYAECLKTFQRENLRAIWDKEWISSIGGKQAAFSAVAEFYQSLVCREKKAIGEEIARLRIAIEKFKAAQSRSGKNLFSDLLNKAERNLAEVEKDNDFIYHERVPDYKSLEPIGRAPLAKLLPVAEKMSQNFKDLFSSLVPVAVHQALASYDLRKTEIVNTEITKLRESTQELNGMLASLNLPAAIEVTDSNTGLPPSIIEKAQTVASLGGISELSKMIEELPELLKRNQDVLDETDRMLNEEKAADDALRQQFKDKWTRTPSDKLTEMFRSNAAKYRQIITNAIEADRLVQSKFTTHKPMIELLSKPASELESSLPSGNGSSLQNSSSVSTLRSLMQEVETIKAEREAIEAELKSATTDMKDKFLLALSKEGEINEPALSYQTLGQTYGPLQKQVAESLEKQKSLIERIRQAHQEFTAERGSTGGGRDAMMCQLAAAHDVFRDLLNNLKEGTKFYNDLTQLLVTFQNKVSDFCFARKTEKEELMKDLTQESSRATPAVPPATPSYHTEPKPENPSPTTSSGPQPLAPGQGPNLPYPVYVQGMPIPYGSTTAPYPSYVPPPMPQGYNPYGTWPGNYQNYQQPPNFQQPGAYPPGTYPQNPQQPAYRPPW